MKHITFFSLLFALFCCVAEGIAQNTNNPFGYSVQPNLSSSSGNAVGSIEGNYSVSTLGEFSYNMPIEVPQGVSGLSPNLSISYSNRGRNGLLGCGFILSGISSITRGPRNIWHDGTALGIKHDHTDAYYLDGQRMVELTSFQTGVDSVVYCLENDPYTRIVLHGLNANTQMSHWFEMHATDGKTYQFGRTTNAQQGYLVNVIPKVNAWYIEEITDPIGNTIEYSYTKDNYSLYPSLISYGVNSISFTYENRSDKVYFSVEGNKGICQYRLKSITAQSNNQQFRKYVLNYSESSDGTTRKHSRLQNVTMYGADNSTSGSVPPTSFNWNSLPSYLCTVSYPACYNSLNHLGAPDSNLYFYSADLNADGLTDIVEYIDGNYGPYGASSNRILVRYASRATSGGINFTNDDYISLSNPACIPGMWMQDYQMPLAIDLDGDGTNELLVPQYSNSIDSRYFGFYVYRGSNPIGGVKWDPVTTDNANDILYCAADFNNDGKEEIIAIDRKNYSGNQYTGALMGGYTQQTVYRKDFKINVSDVPLRIFAVDADCDGMKDVVVFHNSGYTFVHNDGTWLSSNSVEPNANDCINHSLTFSPRNINIGDFDGDGIADFLLREPDTRKFYFEFGKGDGSYIEQFATELSGNPYSSEYDTYNCNILDIDGDGLSDVIINHKSSTTETRWYFSNGETLLLHKTASSAKAYNGEGRYYMIGDFNGDGLHELASFSYDCYNGTNSNEDSRLRVFYNHWYNSGTGQISQITDGYENTVNVEYKSLTDDQFYQKGNNAQYPIIDLTLPIPCVSRVTESNGAGANKVNSYTYQGITAHLLGRGILGMEKVITTNETTGLVSERVAELDPVSFYEEYITEDQYLNNHVQEYKIINTIYKKPNKKSFFKECVSHNLTDFNNVNHYTITYYNKVNGTFDNNLKGSYWIGETIKDSAYVYKGGRYLPTVVKRDRYEEDFDDDWEWIQLTNLSYNNQGLVISRIENANTTFPVTTDYVYDSYGNVIQETTHADGVETIVNTYEYDNSHRFVTRSVERGYIEKEYQYDALGRLTSIIDKTQTAAPKIKTMEYDAFGNLVREVYPSGAETTYIRGWGNSNNKKYYVVEQGTAKPWVKTWYDAKGNVVLVESIGADDIAINESTAYDSYGRVVGITKTIGNVATTESITYDWQDRVVSRTITDNIGGTPKQTLYSYNRPLEVSCTENGRTTKRQYDVFGKLHSVKTENDTITYLYNGMWKPLKIACLGDTITMTYDDRGNRITLIDPDAGITQWTYDAYNRVHTETDSRMLARTFIYDNRGQLIQELPIGDFDEPLNYTYGTDGNTNGLLKRLQFGSNIIDYSYDAYGRRTSESRTTQFGLREKQRTYNSAGLVSSITYPDGLSVEYLYDSYGNKNETRINNESITKMAHFTGSTVQYDWGNNLQLQQSSNSRNMITSINLTNNNTPVRSMTFSYDGQTDNLLSRSGFSEGTESFQYDQYERLTNYSDGNNETTVEYAPNGNILSKTGYGDFFYDINHPHAVARVNNTMGLISTDMISTSFNSLGKIKKVEKFITGESLTFSYGPDKNRWVMNTRAKNQIKRSKLYFDDYEENIDTMLHRQSVCYFDDDAICVGEEDGSRKIYYMLRDPLGTIVNLITPNGTIVYSASYDAWGKCTSLQNTTSPFVDFRRGFTGHEMLLEFDLVNMNGRMYDPLVGRFLSPDPYVQMPDNAQNFNRYSYCLNNPLKYTDPSGEFWGLSLFTGFAKGIIEMMKDGDVLAPITNAINNLSNDIKLSLGWYQGSSKQIVSRFTWELPQNILGYQYSKSRLIFEDVDHVEYFDGATYVVNDNSHSHKGITLGSFININDKGPMPRDDSGHFAPQKDPLYMHEYGHYLQSQEYGLGYLFSVGVQSLISAATSEQLTTAPFSTHANKWFERSANRKAKEYFGEKYGVDWNTKYVPSYWLDEKKNKFWYLKYKDFYPL